MSGGEVSGIVKTARDFALQGLYPEALGKFREAMSTIDGFVSGGGAVGMEEQWRKAKKDLGEEVEAVNNALSALRKLKSLRDVRPLNSPDIHSAGRADPSERKSPDPDIWAPPSPVSQPFQPRVPARNKQPAPRREPAKKEPANVRPGAGRAPAEGPKGGRPGAKPAAKPAANVKADSDPTRTTFLQSKFPDGGTGPDMELIQMLEHDVVEASPAVTFDQIAELNEAKQLLEEAVLLPIIMPEYFQGIRKPWKGILLFGPPGTGKTMLAKAVATLGKTTFFNVSSSTLASKWRGESEKLVRLLFEMARFYAPATLFFDEVDGLGSKRGESSEHEASRRVKNELLTQIDGVGTEDGKHIVVIAATNRPWDLDEALRRRLEKRIYIPLPMEEGRRRLFEIYCKGVEISEELDWEFLLRKSEGYSGSDIASVCRDAAMMPLRKKMMELRQKGLGLQELEKMKSDFHVPLGMNDFKDALANVQKSVSPDDLERYAEWMATFGSSV